MGLKKIEQRRDIIFILIEISALFSRITKVTQQKLAFLHDTVFPSSSQRPPPPIHLQWQSVQSACHAPSSGSRRCETPPSAASARSPRLALSPSKN